MTVIWVSVSIHLYYDFLACRHECVNDYLHIVADLAAGGQMLNFQTSVTWLVS
jgi:hypothetical protein